MSLLMPEYERQLRVAARRLAGNAAASAKASHRGVGSRPFLAFTAAGVVAVAVAAVVLIGHHGPVGGTSPGTTLPAIQYDCPAHQILRPEGALVPAAHGTVGGQRWTLEIDSTRRGLGSAQAGRFLLGGRAYGFCETGLVDTELVNAGPQGIVYGLAPRPYHPPIVVEATTAHGTAVHPVRAHMYPATTRQLAGATLFVRALPASACAYRVLAVVTERPDATVGFGVGPFTRSCAPGQLRQTSQRAGGR